MLVLHLTCGKPGGLPDKSLNSVNIKANAQLSPVCKSFKCSASARSLNTRVFPDAGLGGCNAAIGIHDEVRLVGI